jgi:hypothetical protein
LSAREVAGWRIGLRGSLPHALVCTASYGLRSIAAHLLSCFRIFAFESISPDGVLGIALRAQIKIA